jgi:hypothetical protein
VRLAETVITGNGTLDVFPNGGTVYSYGDNHMNTNAGSDAGLLSGVSMQ